MIMWTFEGYGCAFASGYCCGARGFGAWGVLHAQRPFREYQAANRIERFPAASGLEARRPNGLAPACVIRPSGRCMAGRYRRRAGRWRSAELDHRLSPLGPASASGHSPADAHRHAVGGAGGGSGRRRRRLQLAHDVCGGGGALESDRRHGGSAPRIFAARRLPHGATIFTALWSGTSSSAA